MGWLSAIGKGIGKGFGWLIRHPEAIDGGWKLWKGIRKKKPLPEEAPLPELGNTQEPTP